MTRSWPEPGPSLSFPEAVAAGAAAPRWWATASLVLGIILVVQITLQAQYPASPVASLLAGGQKPVALAESDESIQIVSRDMHRHPTLDDAIIVSATLRNPSSERLAWPVVEVRLYDPSQTGARGTPAAAVRLSAKRRQRQSRHAHRTGRAGDSGVRCRDHATLGIRFPVLLRSV